jgi:xanthine dehydrogenase YagT iron-sulfur-binding subunit
LDVGETIEVDGRTVGSERVCGEARWLGLPEVVIGPRHHGGLERLGLPKAPSESTGSTSFFAEIGQRSRGSAGIVDLSRPAVSNGFPLQKDLSMAPKDESPDSVNLSRRNFLKSTGVVGLAAGVIAPSEAGAQTGPAVVGPGEVPVRLTVNGRQLNLTIEPRVTLLDALRMRADLTGNKRGCDRGACGACTMLVDGRPIYSCSTLAIEVQGKQIRNVEGLANGDTLHPVQQAFCDKDALMCGFCTPGFIMASVGLLEKIPNPSPEQIRKGLDGNICRCGTFNRIFEAVSSVKGVQRG